MLYDIDLSLVNMGIFGDKVVGKNGSEKLWRVDWMLLGEDVRGLFHGVRGYNDAVVGFGIPVRH